MVSKLTTLHEYLPDAEVQVSIEIDHDDAITPFKSSFEDLKWLGLNDLSTLNKLINKAKQVQKAGG